MIDNQNLTLGNRRKSSCGVAATDSDDTEKTGNRVRLSEHIDVYISPRVNLQGYDNDRELFVMA